MLLPDGSRRRTLGGVFFVVVRVQLTPAQQRVVFPPKPYQKKTKPPRPVSDTPSPSTPTACATHHLGEGPTPSRHQFVKLNGVAPTVPKNLAF